MHLDKKTEWLVCRQLLFLLANTNVALSPRPAGHSCAIQTGQLRFTIQRTLALRSLVLCLIRYRHRASSLSNSVS